MSMKTISLGLLSILLFFSCIYQALGDDSEYSVASVLETEQTMENKSSYLRSSIKHKNSDLNQSPDAILFRLPGMTTEGDEFQLSVSAARKDDSLIALMEEILSVLSVDYAPPTETDLVVNKPDIEKKLPRWWKQAAAAILIVVGLIEVFVGYRFFKITMFTYGFLVVGVPVWFTFWFYVNLGSLSEILRHCVCIGVAMFGGILGGTLLVCVSVVAIFMLGAGLGVVTAFILNAAVFSHFNLAPNMANVPLIGSAVGLGIVFGIVALCVRKIFIIMATSIIGAFAVVYGASLYHKEFDFISMAKDIAEGDRTYPNFVYGYLAGFVFLAVLGIIIQFTVTAKGMTSKGKQVDDAYSELEVALTRIMGKHSKTNKKSKKKKKRSKRNKAAALLAEYEPGGAYYDYYYDDNTEYGYDEYDDSRSYYDGYGYDRASTYSRPMSAAMSRRSSMYREDDNMTAYSMRSGRKKSYTGGLL